MAFETGEIRTVSIIPAFNEAERVGNVARAALRSSLVDAVVVVNDASEDNTAFVAENSMTLETKNEKPTLVYSHPYNKGKTETLRTGVEIARSIGGTSLSALVFLDADSSPIWTRDTKGNMKLWQVAVNSLSGELQEPLAHGTMEGRNDAFLTLFARYIDEIAEPVATGREIMRVGMYQRNFITDTVLILLKASGHAGNRAIPLNIWDNMFAELKEKGEQLGRWEIEGALSSYIKELCKTDPSIRQGSFMMHGVINVGSRVKTGGMVSGVKRMIEIHEQALKGRTKFRS